MHSVSVIRRRNELEQEKREKLDRLIEMFRAAIREGFTGRIAIEIEEGVLVSAEVVQKIKL